MSANDIKPHMRPHHRDSQVGAFAVEFAVVILVFFTFMFGVIEMARIMYMWNTLQEVTRRAASVAASTDFSDVSAMNLVRQQSIFRSSPGTLVAGNPVTDAHIRIDYMALGRDSNGTMTLNAIPPGTLPSSPARNQVVCMDDPNSASCIRFVRVRVCAPGSDADVCDSVEYVPMLPLIPLSSLTLPPSTTIVRAETLGYEPGQPLSP
jgi:Flp pilus assembly protein TadG